MTDISGTLEERGEIYGDFTDHAFICQTMKSAIHLGRGWKDMSYIQRQAIDTILDKIARMANGDPKYLDNVRDIIGYAELMYDRMKTENGTKDVVHEYKVYENGEWVDVSIL